jgi:hypothetical protein
MNHSHSSFGPILDQFTNDVATGYATAHRWPPATGKFMLQLLQNRATDKLKVGQALPPALNL